MFTFARTHLITIPALIFLSAASTAENCYHNDVADDFRDLIHKTAAVGNAGRMTEEEYAKAKKKPLAEVKKEFAATGTLKCGTKELSAQLTGANNVITTAGHSLFTITNCTQVRAPESCKFSINVGGKSITKDVAGLVDTGFNSCRVGARASLNQDWAVMSLKEGIEGADYYELPYESDSIKPMQNVVAVAAQSIDFVRKDKSGKKIYPKSIEDCQIQTPNSLNLPRYFESDCDAAIGASGGSILKRGASRHTLVGIIAHGDETPEQVDDAIAAGRINQKDYSRGTWATYSVEFKGDFLRAAERAAGGRAL